MSRLRVRDLVWPALVVPITVGGCLLALYWTTLVPIFQAPDEPSHFDYVMTVYSHGLVNLRDRGEYDYYGFAHPYSRYLLRQTGFLDVAFHPEVRMQPGYGSTGYYSTLDRNAPAVPTPFMPSLDPFLVSLYPFGFYLLAAAWLHLLAPAGLGVSGLFFAARALSVLMLAATLPLTYLAGRELGLRPWVAATLTAVIAFFPLTSFVASYIQPDNLSWLLVTLAVYLALRARRARFTTAWLVGLGIVLGCLLATKLQFYVCVLGAVIAMVVAERLYLRDRWRGPRLFPLGWAALLTPSVVAAAVLAWVVVWPGFPFGGAIGRSTGTAHISTVVFTGALHQGAGAFFWYLVSSLQAAFANYYTGSTVLSYWAAFGWQDVPLIIHSPRTTALVHDLVVAANVAVLILLALRLQGTIRRLLRLARAGKPRTALRLAFADPFLNSYLLFTALMFGLFVLTNATFGPQGRNWIPFLLPAFMVGAVYAPRVFSGRRFQAATTALVLVALLAFSTVGSYYAQKDVRARYYGAGPHVSSQDPGSSLALGDGLEFNVDQVTASGWPAVPAESYLRIEGWSLDGTARKPSRALVARLDDRLDFPGVVGLPRPDVAQAKGDPVYSGSGFAVGLAATSIGPGVHRLTLRFLSADGRGYYETAPIEFTVSG